MARRSRPDPKEEAFATSPFLDPRDLVQVKYEMVRRVRQEGAAVAAAAAAFGFSRPSWYAAAAALDQAGLPGLLPAQPGPRRRRPAGGTLRAAPLGRARRRCRRARAGVGAGDGPGTGGLDGRVADHPAGTHRQPRAPTPRGRVASGRGGAGRHGHRVAAAPADRRAQRSELMAADAAAKVTAEHLRRAAYLYVRQSTLRQVVENTTSTDRQYALRERAVALGWPAEQVIVIDEDLGRSGASAQGRDGFQRLVADVGMGRAGIVLGLEVSRLARNNADWHRLLEICALTGTLILDEDGLYDPCSFNDRLVLGLKGAMSEAELHLLKARLRGGQLAKARRGELAMPLPVGFVYDPAGRVVLDPDQGVQQGVRHLVSTFARTGSARATVKAFADQGLLFPLRVRTGPKRGELGWHPLAHHRVLQVLHNPRYAGAFTYGRRRARRGPDGQPRYLLQPRQDWIALIPDAHVGYLSWEQFEDNQRRLAACAAAHGQDRRAGPPREGQPCCRDWWSADVAGSA